MAAQFICILLGLALCSHATVDQQLPPSKHIQTRIAAPAHGVPIAGTGRIASGIYLLPLIRLHS